MSIQRFSQNDEGDLIRCGGGSWVFHPDHAAAIAAKDEEIARLNKLILAKDSVIEELTAVLLTSCEDNTKAREAPGHA